MIVGIHPSLGVCRRDEAGLSVVGAAGSRVMLRFAHDLGAMLRCVASAFMTPSDYLEM
jgi:hypothetical protein